MTIGRLGGKTAIITGSARGMGAAEARMLVAEGASVLVCDVLDDLGQTVADQLGDTAAYTHLDVSDASQWKAAVQLARARFGNVHILVNNAGIARSGTIEQLPLADYDRTIAVNQTGVWLGIRAIAPLLRESGGGSIVNISSVAGLTASASLGAYGAAKWAVRGITKTAAVELAVDKIRVNSIHPGLIETDILGEAGWSIEEARSMAPLSRLGSANDVARMVVYLASDESSYCTGCEFVVDGGLHAGVQPGGAG
jgi:3alpha(or 20beta)-hydroxysteroid dehydrogenase